MSRGFMRRHEAAGSTLGSHMAAWQADAFIETWVCWREACDAVRSAYEHWRRGAEPANQGLAFATYRAALDREEHAALLFRARVEQIAHGRT